MRILSAFTVLLLAVSPAVLATETDQRAAQVDALFAQYTEPGSPGAAVSVYQGDKVVKFGGYGLADLEFGAPITEQTQFHVASVSKQFTAFAILLLNRDGKVDLDADIRTYLPYVPNFGKPITVRHLIHHSSGLRDQWDLLELGGLDESARLRQRYITKLVARQRELNFTPGTEYLYSNTGYTLLAEIVSAVSGKTLRQFAQERIFGPLQMTRTFFYDDVTEVVPGRANSYRRKHDGGWSKQLLSYDTYGATSLFTTVGDLAKWARNFTSPRVGDRVLIDLISHNGTLDDGRAMLYGMGLYRTTIGGRDVVAHSGADAGFLAIFVYYPGYDFAVSITANTDADLTETVASIADLYLPPSGKSKQSPPAAKPVTEQSFAGLYVAPYERAIELKAEGGALYRYDMRGNREKLQGRADGSVDFGDPEYESFRPIKDGDGRISALEFAATDEHSPVRYVKAQRFKPSPQDLSEYTGSFYSEELDATYRVAATGGRLTVTSLWAAEPYTFAPLLRDRFEAQGRVPMSTLLFQRAADGKVEALRIHTGRSRNLLFRRVDGLPR